MCVIPNPQKISLKITDPLDISPILRYLATHEDPDDDNSDRDYGPPDPHDDDDFGHGGGAPVGHWIRWPALSRSLRIFHQ